MKLLKWFLNLFVEKTTIVNIEEIGQSGSIVRYKGNYPPTDEQIKKYRESIK